MGQGVPGIEPEILAGAGLLNESVALVGSSVDLVRLWIWSLLGSGRGSFRFG